LVKEYKSYTHRALFGCS